MRKRIIKIAFLFIMMTFICSIATSSVSSAKTYTRKDATKKIKSLNKDIKKLKKEYKKQYNNEKVPAGYNKISLSRVSVYNSHYYKEFMGSAYYYIQNPGAISGGLLISAYVKRTGATEIYYDDYGNRRTCYVVEAIKNPHAKSNNIKSKLEKKKKELKVWKKAIKQEIEIWDAPVDFDGIYKIGEKDKLSYNLWENAKLNKKNLNTVKWSSSNPDIVSIDSKGKITCLNSGTVTITASLSISKKKDQVVINVLPRINQLSFEQPEYYITKENLENVNYDGDHGYYYINLRLNPIKADADLEQSIIYPDGRVEKWGINNGETDLVKVSVGLSMDESKDCTVIVKDKLTGLSTSCVVHYTYVPEPTATPEPESYEDEW